MVFSSLRVLLVPPGALSCVEKPSHSLSLDPTPLPVSSDVCSRCVTALGGVKNGVVGRARSPIGSDASTLHRIGSPRHCPLLPPSPHASAYTTSHCTLISVFGHKLAAVLGPECGGGCLLAP